MSPDARTPGTARASSDAGHKLGRARAGACVVVVVCVCVCVGGGGLVVVGASRGAAAGAGQKKPRNHVPGPYVPDHAAAAEDADPHPEPGSHSRADSASMRCAGAVGWASSTT